MAFAIKVIRNLATMRSLNFKAHGISSTQKGVAPRSVNSYLLRPGSAR